MKQVPRFSYALALKFAVTIIVLFVVETGIMHLLSLFGMENSPFASIIDSLTLVSVMTPLIYLLFIIPMGRDANLRASEKKYRLLAETLKDGIISIDKDAVVTYANSSMAAMLGYANKDEMIGRSFLQFIDEEGKEHARQLKEGVYNLPRHEHRFTTWDGGWIFAMVSAAPLFDEKNKYAGAVVAVTDITERMAVEAELKRVNRMLTMLSQCNQLLVTVMDEETLLQSVCLIILDTGGYALAQVSERVSTAPGVEIAPRITTCRDPAAKPFLTPETMGDCPCIKAMIDNETVIIRNIAQCAEYSTWCAVSLKNGCNTVIALPLRFSDSVDAVLSIYAEDASSFTESDVKLLKELAEDLSLGVRTIRDRSKKDAAERRMRESEQRFRLLAQTAHDAIISINAEGAVIFWNDGATKIFGYDGNEMIGKDVTIIMPERYHAPHRAGLARVAAGGESRLIGTAVSIEGVRKGGVEFPLELSLAAWETKGKKYFTAFIRDITQRKKAEESLLASERALSEAQKLAHLGNWDLDLKTGKGTWSDESYRIFGCQPGAFEPTFEKFMEMVHPDDRKSLEEYLRKVLDEGQSQFEFDVRIIRPDGEERIIHDTLEVIRDKEGKPVKITGVNFDITERKEYERKLEIANQELKAALEQVRDTQAVLMRSEKLAAVGTLSAGVAHEILNPLNIISTICQLLLLDERRGRVHESLNEIMLQIRRTAKITNNLRVFAREKKFDITPVDLQQLFNHTVELMERDLNLDNIFIDRQYDPKTPLIMADADQLAQVFMNLLTNSRDVLQPRRGGIITAGTKALENGVEFTFRDNGPGMPEDIIDRIFDPFFTTKDPGKGTGLGLSVVHRIIEAHGGTIRVESREGEGTKFTIFLPKDSSQPVRPKKNI